MGGIATNEEPDAVDRVRLHITPFNPQLLDRILAPSVRALASDISFHTEQTYPERGFGYVELPAMEAQKLKSKLNGSTLKGAKVRIEEAQPETKRKAEKDEVDEDKKSKKLARKVRSKPERGVLAGHELEEGRHVKRAWTDGAGKEEQKKGKKAKKTDGVEGDGHDRKLRFKTVVPPNAQPLVDDSKKKQKKEKKDGKDKLEKRSRKTTIVQEFDKTKKSRDMNVGAASGKHGTLSFEDGKGWVDESGEVVEAERTSKRPRRKARLEKAEQIEPANEDHIMEEAESIAGTTPPANPEPTASSVDINTPVDTPQEMADPTQEVHPLEALFKRPTSSTSASGRPKPGPIDTSFSFFAANAAEDAAEGPTGLPPQTPHTKRDLEWRSLRSAAPTPDTAAIGRKFSFPFSGDGDEDEDEDDEADDMDVQGAVEGDDVDMDDAGSTRAGAEQEDGDARGEETGFRKWFYDNRGDFNRGWKKRRREVKKRKRQADNKVLGHKVA